MQLGKMGSLGLTALKSNFSQLERPYKLTFSITYWCQSRCLTCNIWELKPKGELELREIQEFTRKNPYFKWVEITGGEPFLRSDIVEIARAFKENCRDLYILTMPTNSLSNHDMELGKIKQILELGIARVAITLSLDGDQELHDKIRGVPGNFMKVMDMYARLKELKKTHPNLFFIFGFTMSKFNQGLFDRTVKGVQKHFPEVTYNNFHLNVAQISDSYYQNGELQIRPEVVELANEIKSVIGKRQFEVGVIPFIEDAFLKKLVTYVETGKAPVRSKSLDASLFMDSYGNVYPSIMWGRKIGNIRDTSYDLMPIWHNAEAEEVRKLVREGKEPGCWTACEAYQSLVGNIGSMVF